MSSASPPIVRWAPSLMIPMCICIACYEIVPIDANSSTGAGGASTTDATIQTSASVSTGGSGKVGVSASGTTSAVSTTASTVDAASSSAAQYMPTETCKSLTYEGACSTALGIALHWREASAIQTTCDPGDDVPPVGQGFCAISFCTTQCSLQDCTPSAYTNAACWGETPVPDAQPCSGFLGTCQDGVAIAQNPNDPSDCLIRDCNDETRICDDSGGVARCIDPP